LKVVIFSKPFLLNQTYSKEKYSDAGGKKVAGKQSLPANTLKYDFLHTHSAKILQFACCPNANY
jgi:hypothetical protein